MIMIKIVIIIKIIIIIIIMIVMFMIMFMIISFYSSLFDVCLSIIISFISFLRNYHLSHLLWIITILHHLKHIHINNFYHLTPSYSSFLFLFSPFLTGVEDVSMMTGEEVNAYDAFLVFLNGLIVGVHTKPTQLVEKG